ncbi:GerAB/ArcD/ProY family transporter [Cohnella terricola]|uniref:GerAB/ArcD/ProY family transporter n=1 Tax=Cohnella terricola TaxID=1289167 RepID=UPI001648B06D|nr:GerAB/ArcD/ProY family transporter [Cohnella terricola]
MDTRFSRLQLVFLLLLTLGISNHVFIIPHLLKDAGRDAWFSILLAYPFLVAWTAILYFILKSMRDSPFDVWLESRIGKFGRLTVCWCLSLYFLVLGMLIVYDTCMNTEIYFLPKTPNVAVVLSDVIVSYFAARNGLKTIVYFSIILLPIVWLFGYFVSLSTLDSKDYSLIKPFFSEGIASDIRGGMIVFGGSIEMLMLVVLQHKLKKPLNYGTIVILLTLLFGLILGPTLGSLSAFGPNIAGTLRFPAFEQWRLVTVGEYISHVDFLAVFQMMAGSIARTALLIYLLSELIGMHNPRRRQAAMIGGAALMALPSLLHVSDLWMQTVIHDHFYVSSFIFGLAAIAILFPLTYLPGSKKGETS